MSCKLTAVAFSLVAWAWMTASVALAGVSFVVTGNMNPGLLGHAAVRLADGRVLVTGGFASSGGLSAGTQIYDPRTGSWTTGASMNTSRYYHCAVVLADGRVLVAGGYGSGATPLTSAEIFDPADGSWAATGSLIAPLKLTEAVRLPDGRVLIPGIPGEAVQLYSPDTGTWRASTGIVSGSGIPVSLANGRILVIGRDQSQEFDPVTELWSSAATKTLVGVEKAVGLANGKVLVICSGTPTSKAEIYDPAMAQWSQTASLAALRSYPTTTLLSDGTVLVAGGGNSGVPELQTAEIYAPDLGTWSTLNMNLARAKHTATPLSDGTVLLAGGDGATAAELCVFASAGAIDTAFNPQVSGGSANPRVSATAVQPDGKIVLVGKFTSVGGTPRVRIARVNVDGSLDAAFAPIANNTVNCVAIQADGKIVIGGDFSQVGAEARNGLARLNPDGTTDLSFDPAVTGSISCVAIQPDGKIVVGHPAITYADQPSVTRLTENGAIDFTFPFTQSASSVDALAIDADGKIVVGGTFLSAGELARNHLARLNADGTVDGNYAPAGLGPVFSLALQADGRLLAIAIGGTMKRFNADGTTDSSFIAPITDSGAYIYSAALQADGKIVIGGEFSRINGVKKAHVARLNPDGTLDHSLVAIVNGSVFNTLLQADGQVVLTGDFTGTIFPNLSRPGMVRLTNDATVRALTASSSSVARWDRSGAAPEVDFVRFELSVDDGASWAPLGAGTRTNGGWELGGQSFAGLRGLLRARGRESGSYRSSSGLIEEIGSFDFDTFTVAPILSAPAGLTKSPVIVRFMLPEPAKPGTLKLVLTGATHHELVLATSAESAGEHTLSFDSSNPLAAPEIASGDAIPDGSYSAVLSYQDKLEHTAAASASLSTTIDATPPLITPLDGFQSALRVYKGTLLADYSSMVSASDLNGLDGSVVQEPAAGGALTESVLVKLSVADHAGNVGVLEFQVDARPLNPEHRAAFAKGTAAPGQGTNGLPTDAVLTSFGSPALSEQGDLAFVAKWTSASEKRGTGLFLNDRCLAVAGGDASAVAGAGAKWKSFADPVVSEGHVVCLATLSGVPKSGAAVVVGNLSGDDLEKVARAGDTAEGFSIGGAKFKGFQAVSVSGASVAVVAQLRPNSGSPKVTANNDVGIWYYEAGQLTFLMRESDSIEGRTIKTLRACQSGDGSAGESRGTLIRSAANGNPVVTALALFSDGTQGLISQDVVLGPPSLALTRSKDSTVGLEDGTSFATYGPPARTAAKSAIFRGSLVVGNGVTKANASGIFVGPASDGRFTSIVRTDDEASAAGSGATFQAVKDPAVSPSGDVAFSATVKGGRLSGAATKTLWWQPAGESLRLAAQAGASSLPVPDLSGALFASFQSVAVAETRGPIFTATLVPGKGGVRSGQSSGLWAMDFTGTTRLIFRTGLPINDKVVRSFKVLTAVPGSGGSRRSFNELGQIASLATFNDGSQAIVVSLVP